MEVGGDLGAGLGPSIVINSNEEKYDQLATIGVDQMPPGFRFHPTDEEIIIHYLLKKVTDRKFSALSIGEVDLNKCEPWDLPKKAKMGEKEWWFFFEKDRKYATGTRTNRATESGYWKATGKDREIYNRGKNRCQLVIGMKKTLVFYKGRAPKGHRTDWVMHEYRLITNNFSNYNFSRAAKEEWAVCRVFHKKSTGIRTTSGVELERMDSIADHYLLDNPTLPPLTDYSCFSERPNSSFTTEEEDEFKANVSSSKLMLNNNQLQMLQHDDDQKNFLSPPPTLSSHNQYSTPNNLNPNPIISFPQIVHPNSMFPYDQSPSLVYQHQDGLNSTIARNPANFPIKEADQPINSRIHAPNIYTGGQEPERMCKMEPFSFNNSIIRYSQNSTELSAEMATEITSVHSMGDVEIGNPSDQEFEGLFFSPSISDFDSFWSY